MTSAFRLPTTEIVEPFFRVRTSGSHKNSPDKREGMDRSYLDKFEGLPCCIPDCRSFHGVVAHHCRFLDPHRAKGKKPLDKTAVPLCALHHGYSADGVHRVGTRQEQAWFLARGVNALDLATALWLNSHDEQRMLNVIEAHWERAVR